MPWALPASHMLDDGSVGSGTDGDRLLDQAVEELPSMLRGASIEAKGELVQVGIEVLLQQVPNKPAGRGALSMHCIELFLYRLRYLN